MGAAALQAPQPQPRGALALPEQRGLPAVTQAAALLGGWLGDGTLLEPAGCWAGRVGGVAPASREAGR